MSKIEDEPRLEDIEDFDGKDIGSPGIVKTL